MYDFKLFHTMPIFRNCSDNDISRFITCVNPRLLRYEKGEVIHQQDDPLDHILLILSGTLASYRLNRGGQLSLVAKLGSGGIYGHLIAFSGMNRDPLMLIADSDAECLIFPSESFYQPCSGACPAHQLVIRNMIGLLADEAMRLSEKVSYLSCATLKGKIARYLLNESAQIAPGTPFEIPHNREGLAQLLAVARPSLSRTLTQMKEEGLIDYDRNTFRIVDYAQLETLE